MVVEAVEEFVLGYTEADYEDPGEQAPIKFMASGGEFYDARNDSHCLYQKHFLFTRPTCSENINWETADMHMRVS